MEVDLALVGSGGAGLAMLRALDRRMPAGDPGHRGLKIAVFDPDMHIQGRTWCFWDDGDQALAGLAELATAQWKHIEIGSTDGHRFTHPLDPLRYCMVESSAIRKDGLLALGRLGAMRVDEPVEEMTETPEGVLISTSSGPIQARWVLDSRPADPPRDHEGAWFQHFLGWTMRAAEDSFDPAVVTLMDFSVAQPKEIRGPDALGLSFGYVLPIDKRQALVEYTVLSPSPWPETDHCRGLDSYLEERWGPGVAGSEVIGIERGVIVLLRVHQPAESVRKKFRQTTRPDDAQEHREYNDRWRQPDDDG